MKVSEVKKVVDDFIAEHGDMDIAYCSEYILYTILAVELTKTECDGHTFCYVDVGVDE